jgi:hypothetical protein
LAAKNVFSGLLLVSDGALLRLHRVQMHDVALGKPKLAARILRFDGASGARDIRVRRSRYSHIQKASVWLIAIAFSFKTSK